MKNLQKKAKKVWDFIWNIFEKEYVLVTLIILVGFLVRLYRIDNPVADWHSWRQADTASVSRIYSEEGIDLLRPRYHDISSIQTGIYNPEGLRFVEFPIYNAVHSLLFTTVGVFSLEVWGRLLSVFSALFSTYLIYLIGKRFMGKWGGAFSAATYALIPFNIFFTRVILPEPMAVTFGLLGLYLFIKYIDNDKKSLLYSSALAFAVGLAIKPFVFFYLVPAAYLILRKHGIKKTFTNAKVLIPLLVFVNIAIIPFFSWRIYINQWPHGIPHFGWAFNGDDIRFRPAFWRWIFAERVGELILGGWGLIPFGIALVTKIKDKFAYFNHAFLFGIFLYVSTFATASVRHDYYQTIAIPAIALTFGYGAWVLWKDERFGEYLGKTILVISVFLMLVIGASQVKEFYKINHPEIIKAGDAVDKIAPEDALVIAPYAGDTAFLYQTRRRGWPVVEESFDEVIEKGADYYVSVNFKDADTQKLMEMYEVVERTDQYVVINLQERQE